MHRPFGYSQQLRSLAPVMAAALPIDQCLSLVPAGLRGWQVVPLGATTRMRAPSAALIAVAPSCFPAKQLDDSPARDTPNG